MTNHEGFESGFSTRTGQTFSTRQIEEIMLSHTDIESGSIRPNDHASGNEGDCECVGTPQQIFDRIKRGMYRVRNFDKTGTTGSVAATSTPKPTTSAHSGANRADQ